MDLLLWQLADSAFPAGGFAHSGGLEAAWQQGEVTDRAAVEQFTRDVIGQTGRSLLPFVTEAHAHPQKMRQLDAFCDAFLSNPVANRASRAQGRAFLTACARSFPDRACNRNPRRHRDLTTRTTEGTEDLDRVVSIEDLQNRVSSANLRGHQAPLFGAVLRALEVDRRSSQRLFLFLTSRTVTTAAVRLGLLGPYEAQRLQSAMSADIDRTLETCGELRSLEIAHTAPLIDLFQSTQDRLYSKLFQS